AEPQTLPDRAGFLRGVGRIEEPSDGLGRANLHVALELVAGRAEPSRTVQMRHLPLVPRVGRAGLERSPRWCSGRSHWPHLAPATLRITSLPRSFASPGLTVNSILVFSGWLNTLRRYVAPGTSVGNVIRPCSSVVCAR